MAIDIPAINALKVKVTPSNVVFRSTLATAGSSAVL